MPIAHLKDVDISYEIIGSGPPLLFVAGLGGASSYWRLQREFFSQNYTVILHDHRGTGLSSRPNLYSVELMADDVIGLMDFLNIGQAHFLGHSTGAAIGQVIAIEHPERLASMVQYASWTRADDHFRWCFDIRKSLLQSGGIQSYTHATPIFLMPPWFIKDNSDRLKREEVTAIAGAPPPEVIEARINAILAYDRRDELASINVPTQVLCAKDDILTPPYFSKEIANLIPKAELNWLEQGGHACSQVLPDEFNLSVSSFIDKQQQRLMLKAFV